MIERYNEVKQAIIAWSLKTPRPKPRDGQTKSNTSMGVLQYQNKTMTNKIRSLNPDWC